MSSSNLYSIDSLSRFGGKKQYELTNHLGNVVVSISDRKVALDNNSDNVIDDYEADVVSDFSSSTEDDSGSESETDDSAPKGNKENSEIPAVVKNPTQKSDSAKCTYPGCDDITHKESRRDAQGTKHLHGLKR